MSEKASLRKHYSDLEEVLQLEGVTYDSYLKRLCKDGVNSSPITEQQWNMMVDIGVGSFKMQYTDTVNTKMKNMLIQTRKTQSDPTN